jgi:hypothetical protein
MAGNIMIKDIEKLNEIIDAIDNKDLSTAKDKAIVWRDNLQGELEAMELYYTKHTFHNFEPNTAHETKSVEVKSFNNPYTKGEGI